MLLEINHHSGVPIYRQVVDQIRQGILAGRMTVGEQLTSVRDLAGHLNVNPMTVSKAYAILEMEEFIVRKRGIGLFVAEIAPPEKEGAGMDILEDILRKAAVTAVQFEIPEEKVQKKLSEMIQKFNHRKNETTDQHR